MPEVKKEKLLSFVVSEELYQAVKNKAKEKDKTVSELLRNLCSYLYLDANIETEEFE